MPAARLLFCEVQKCGNANENYDGPFFSFPKDPLRLAKWFENLGPLKSQRKNKFVCRHHFRLEEFVDTFRKRLHKFAVPDKQSGVQDSCCIDNSVEDSCCVDDPADLSCMLPQKRPKLSSSESDSPQIKRLKFDEPIMSSTPVAISSETNRDDIGVNVFKNTPKTRKIKALSMLCTG